VGHFNRALLGHFSVAAKLQGVPFFANGLFEAIELQRRGAPFTMMVRAALDDRPSSQSLVWNQMTETADCVRQGNHPGY
jgi:hypothetical protein